MLKHVSLAQKLHSDILRLVIKYVVCETKPRFQRVQSEKNSLRELLLVCSSWREEALKYLWRDLGLTLDEGNDMIYTDHPAWAQKFQLTCTSASMVKELRVNATMSEIVTINAYKLLAGYIRDTAGFPRAYRLSIEVTTGVIGHLYERGCATRNALLLAQLLKSVTPAATMLDINCTGISEQQGSLDEHVVGVLASSLRKCTEYSSAQMTPASTSIASPTCQAPQLTSLVLSCKNDLDVRIILLHKCSNTLQYLDIGLCHPGALFNDTNGGSVVYPNLTYLQMYLNVAAHTVKQVPIAEIVPFPSLRCLRMKMKYPYDDDVLFRGNSDTLENLEIHLDKAAVAILNESQAFKSKYRNLKQVTIVDKYIKGDLHLVSDDVMTSFLSSLTHAARKIKLSASIALGHLLTITPRRLVLNHVQDLNLSTKSLTLYEILHLLKALSTLAKLKCDIAGLGTNFDRISSDELPDYVATTYSAVGKNLQVWRLPGSNNAHHISFSECVMLLALACPKLRHIENVDGCNYRDNIVQMLQSSPFSKYARQLGWLFDHANP